MAITNYLVVESGMTHIGDTQSSLFGTYVGTAYDKDFKLPQSYTDNERAIIMCRTFHCTGGAEFMINDRVLGNILESHSNNQNEWMLDISVVPKGFLHSGTNIINIICPKNDFVIDNIILWYKTI